MYYLQWKRSKCSVVQPTKDIFKSNVKIEISYHFYTTFLGSESILHVSRRTVGYMIFHQILGFTQHIEFFYVFVVFTKKVIEKKENKRASYLSKIAFQPGGAN